MKKFYFFLLVIILYSCEKDITPIGLVMDIDNNIYNIVTIGRQQWMKENLKTTRLNNGTEIPYVYEKEEWHILNTPAYAEYFNDKQTSDVNEFYSEDYGKLYNWFAVGTGKLCPIGWHVPTNIEWMELIDYLGGNSVAGGKLKEIGTTHWQEPNLGATNESGFTALPGGFCDYNGDLLNLSIAGWWWTSSEIVTQINWDPPVDKAWNILLHKHTTDIFGIINVDYPYPKQAGMSVRCLRNNGR